MPQPTTPTPILIVSFPISLLCAKLPCFNNRLPQCTFGIGKCHVTRYGFCSSVPPLVSHRLGKYHRNDRKRPFRRASSYRRVSGNRCAAGKIAAPRRGRANAGFFRRLGLFASCFGRRNRPSAPQYPNAAPPSSGRGYCCGGCDRLRP